MVTPERFIEMAWTLELSICSLTKETTPDDYLNRCEVAAVKYGIAVYTLDFSLYESPLAAFAAEENRELVATLEQCRRKTLVIFKSAEALAPLECNETFWLRSLLLNESISGLVVIFIVMAEQKKRLFLNRKGAFYQGCVNLN